MLDIRKQPRIQKTVRLNQDEINMINAFALSTGNDFSNAMRYIFLQGFENINKANPSDLQNIFTFFKTIPP